ncbi:DUF3885 domain-containing protein [Rubinisphaera italica]|uniref:DUF3885 domain-containing protein n=1 Tax=Rubinisphaera italica TaxID=2527969 RepID=A0A5C5XGP4_9PLAN|nr:hypothetical protein [Rubinisphaera italica]TWT61571.1 hypothetical protein Pan54_23070 [Rubinisphaera italica]
MKFEAFWRSEFPTCAAIPYLLRDAYPERWVRFHSLPESKRYAENETEYQIILHRHNAVLDQLATQDVPLLLASTEFGETTTPTRADSPLVALDPSARCDWTFKADPADSENYYRYLFISEWKWKPGIFDPILRLVADWKIVDTMIVCPTANWICHPYNGGADFILPNRQSRDQLKARFADWLSSHPRGF